MSGRYAVVLLNLGGPDSLDAIEPFLFNLFSDPDIFKIPFGQKTITKFISKMRSKRVVEQYKMIGGKSPINELTELQRNALESALNSNGGNYDVFTAMRYWHPLTEEVIEGINSQNYKKILLLPLYPHYSIVTVGSSVNEWFNHYKGERSKICVVGSYFDNPAYHEAVNERIDQTLDFFHRDLQDDVFILFSAHSVPKSIIEKGDQYQKEIIESVELIMRQRNQSHDYGISYQSKVGPVKWLEPSTEHQIKQLAQSGKKNLLVVPISFVSDHIETLYELGIEYKKLAEENGIENYFVMRGLNDSKLFITLLKQLVLNRL